MSAPSRGIYVHSIWSILFSIPVFFFFFWPFCSHSLLKKNIRININMYNIFRIIPLNAYSIYKGMQFQLPFVKMVRHWIGLIYIYISSCKDNFLSSILRQQFRLLAFPVKHRPAPAFQSINFWSNQCSIGIQEFFLIYFRGIESICLFFSFKQCFIRHDLLR